jgi:hypothetical protein
MNGGLERGIYQRKFFEIKKILLFLYSIIDDTNFINKQKEKKLK